MVKRFLNWQSGSMSGASVVLGFFYLASALLGILRDRLLVWKVGVGGGSDVYYAAFRIPDFVAMTLVMGSISAALIPLFAKHLKQKSAEEAWHFASRLLNVLLFILIPVSLLMILLAPQIISLIAPGFSQEKQRMAVLLTRIMMLNPLVLGVSNMASGVLQVSRRFLATALAPVMYNLGIVLGILFLFPSLGLKGLAIGVVLGGLLHLLIQIPALRASGFSYQKKLDFKDKTVLEALKLMGPRSFGLASGQMTFVIITIFASHFAIGSLSMLNLANNLASLVIGVVGVSFSTAVLPVLSSAFVDNNVEHFKKVFSQVFKQIVFFTIPLSVLFFVFSREAVSLILLAGDTGAGNATFLTITSACLMGFSLTLFLQALTLLCIKAFYGLQNTIIPTLGSLLFVGLFLGFSFLFNYILAFDNIFSQIISWVFGLDGLAIGDRIKNGFGIVGLVLAMGVAGFFDFIFLFYFLRQKTRGIYIRHLAGSVVKTIFAGLLMTGFAFFIRWVLIVRVPVELNFWQLLFASIFSALLSLCAFGFFAWLFKSEEAISFFAKARKMIAK